MSNESYTEKELQELEASFRRFGTPYVTPEPDERYFANFRVRVMEQIDAKQVASKRPVISSIIEWLSASAFRGVSISAAVLGIAFGAFLLMRSPQAPPQVAEVAVPPVVTAPQLNMPATSHEAIKPPVKVAPVQKTLLVKETPNTTLAEKPAKTSSEQIAEEASDFSNFDETLSVGNTDDPIDYSSLSEGELESLVDVASTMN
ncbi:MAG TPA: hypothetical protein VFO76_02085 [Candidatus Kapabacteria bacterium]|nr:hypothetical protein [Candidatus Kapabacteria bacterium]